MNISTTEYTKNDITTKNINKITNKLFEEIANRSFLIKKNI